MPPQLLLETAVRILAGRDGTEGSGAGEEVGECADGGEGGDELGCQRWLWDTVWCITDSRFVGWGAGVYGICADVLDEDQEDQDQGIRVCDSPTDLLFQEIGIVPRMKS